MPLRRAVPCMPTRQPSCRHRPTSEQPLWKHRLYTVIFESDTPGGKDLALLVANPISVVGMLMEKRGFFRAAHPDPVIGVSLSS